MKQGIFEKIANLINGTPDTKDTDCGNKTATAGDGITRRQELVNAGLTVLRNNYDGIRVSMNEKTLTLWIKDGLFYDSLVSDRFVDDFSSAINNECGFVFRSVEIMQGVPDGNYSEIMDGCYMQINQKQTCQTVSRAVVTAVEGRGSMIDGQLVIDSAQIAGLPNARYNIGAGRNPKTADNSFRVNQIAIDDNPESPEYDNNKYVSRAHAHITYSDQYGFMLNVEHGGSRLAQKRTHIHRGGTKIELTDPLIPEPLHDGDYIVLSNHVNLLFKEI